MTSPASPSSSPLPPSPLPPSRTPNATATTPNVARLWKIASKARSPLALQLLGRTLGHAALVGVVAGVVGSLFVLGVEHVEHAVLGQLGGYTPLRASGERQLPHDASLVFRPWLLLFLPAVGALFAGLLSRMAPEIRGGGADAIICAFHHEDARVRARVPLLKALASILTLGFGGAGGREGPTMQIGGALGALVGTVLRTTARERRILLVAGAAAGMSAVFRTPLGAALLAVEVLHRDDFEADALVPSVLASVVAYSICIGFFGDQSALFAHAPRYPFVPAHLPLYAMLAVVVSLAATLFLSALSGVRFLTAKLPFPPWARPAVGGLALGVVATPILVIIGNRLGSAGHGFGILGGGYGAAQIAITGTPWFDDGWRAAEMLLVLAAVKMVATSLTVGSGGSAGDFGPSLVLGGLVGGAFGQVAKLVVGDPRIDAGAFALVGMGTFYGGVAHVPIASLVMVCELAGSYDLLVPLMLAEGIAFVALRNRSLYSAQVATKRESPAHREDFILDVLRGVRVGDVMVKDRPYVALDACDSAETVMGRVGDSTWQDVFPVLSAGGKVIGVVQADICRTMAADPEIFGLTIAHDLMVAPQVVRVTDDLRTALESILENGVRELVVVDAEERVVGFLDEADITRVYHASTANVP